MISEDIFRKRLARMQRWADKAARAWQKTLSETENQYLNVLRDLEGEKITQEASLKLQEDQLKGQLDQAGKDYAKNKYLLEKETAQRKSEIESAQREIEIIKQNLGFEIGRVNQEKLNNQISYERQKSALQELYQEKKRNLLVTREKLIREATQAEMTYKTYRERYGREIETFHAESGKKISFLKDQLSSKQEGWDLALATMKKEIEGITQQKEDIERKLSTVRDDKERELHEIHTQMQVSREQLDLDKVSLVEKAEDDQRRLESEVHSLQEKISKAEKELQDLVLEKENEKKTTEETFQGDESRLKETLKSESEKRDYEQKLYIQEKSVKEKELARLKDEYEKKNSQWDNQIKTLLMQKSVQDAEANAERMRTDREARVVVRSLDAKKEEIQQRLKDLESRHAEFTLNSGKELEILKQRWQWRKDRLWTMWQNRLDLLKKERTALMEQLEHLQQGFTKEKELSQSEFQQNESRIDSIKEAMKKGQAEAGGDRQQREIQLELEKTRIIAQIKECETLVTGWMDKQKLAHAEFAKQKGSMVEDLGFVDRYYRTQQDETELFLTAFQNTLMLFKGELERFELKKNAA